MASSNNIPIQYSKVTSDIASKFDTTEINRLVWASEMQEEFFRKMYWVDIQYFATLVKYILDREFYKHGVAKEWDRRHMMRKLVVEFHPDRPDKQGALKAKMSAELLNKFSVTIIQILHDAKFVNGTGYDYIQKHEIDRDYKPDETSLTRFASDLLSRTVLFHADINPLNDYEGVKTGKDISALIKVLESFNDEPMPLVYKEKLLGLIVVEFMQLLGVQTDNPPKVSLCDALKPGTAIMAGEAIFLKESNEIHIHKPSKPLQSLMILLFKIWGASPSAIDQPDLAKICMYVKKYTENGIGFPWKMVEDFIKTLSQTPQMIFLSDEELQNLTPKKRVEIMEELLDRYSTKHWKEYGSYQTKFTSAQWVQIARLIKTMPSDWEFTRICQEAGEKFALTNPLACLQWWERMDRQIQKERLETVLSNLETSFAQSVHDDIEKSLFTEKNKPIVRYNNDTTQWLYFRASEKKHNGRNSSVQEYPMVHRSTLGPSHQVTYINRIGKNVAYKGASFVDWKEPDESKPSHEILRFPSKADHCHNNSFYGWNEQHDDWNTRQKDKGENYFWESTSPTSVLEEIVRMYFHSLYWNRMPRVLWKSSMDKECPLYEFALRRNIKDAWWSDQKDTMASDVSLATYFTNAVYKKRREENAQNTRSGGKYEEPDYMTDVVNHSPSIVWEELFCTPLHLDKNRIAETCKEIANNWIMTNPPTPIHQKMNRLLQFFWNSYNIQVSDDITQLKSMQDGLYLRCAILNRLNTFSVPPNGKIAGISNDALVDFYVSVLNKDALETSDLEELESAHWIHHEGNKNGASCDTIRSLLGRVLKGEMTAKSIKENFPQQVKNETERCVRLQKDFEDALDSMPEFFSILGDEDMSNDSTPEDVVETMRTKFHEKRESKSLHDYLKQNMWLLYRHNEKHITGIELLAELEKHIQENIPVKTKEEVFEYIKTEMYIRPLNEIVQEMIDSYKSTKPCAST